MGNMKGISYTEWISLISGVMTKGLTCDELNELKVVYPCFTGDSYDTMVYNQLAKLEEYMIRETIRSFQKQMTLCLDEMDLEIAEKAFSKFRKHYINCMFFLQIPEYPENVKNRMTDEIKKNISLFTEIFMKYLKKVEYADNSVFIQDYVYICKKKLQKIKSMYQRC